MGRNSFNISGVKRAKLLVWLQLPSLFYAVCLSMQTFLVGIPLLLFNHTFFIVKDIENSSLSHAGSNVFSCDCQSLIESNWRAAAIHLKRLQAATQLSCSHLQWQLPTLKELPTVSFQQWAQAAAQTSRIRVGSKKGAAHCHLNTSGSPEPSTVSNSFSLLGVFVHKTCKRVTEMTAYLPGTNIYMFHWEKSSPFDLLLSSPPHGVT